MATADYFLVSTHLLFSHYLIVLVNKWSEEPRDYLFCLINGSKPRNIQFTMIQNSEKWQNLERANVWNFCFLKNLKVIMSIISILANNLNSWRFG